jgi:8-oxo-dGTP diphosphatase
LIRVVAGLIEQNGRLLICQRRRGSLFERQWEFPGGKLRPSETPRAGLARELREELGCTTRIGAQIHRTRYQYPEFRSSTELLFFHVSKLSRAPQNLVFERMTWALPGGLLKYDFLPADRELVRRLARKELCVERSKGLRSRSRDAGAKT